MCVLWADKCSSVCSLFSLCYLHISQLRQKKKKMCFWYPEESGESWGKEKICCRSFWSCWHKFAFNRLWPNDLSSPPSQGVLKENLTFRPALVAVAAAAFAHHYGSVCFCPGVKRHQQADVQAAVCWSLCRLILPLLSALGAECKLTFLKMLPEKTEILFCDEIRGLVTLSMQGMQLSVAFGKPN